MPDKVLLSDIAPQIEAIIQNVRDGLAKTYRDKVCLVKMPEKIDFDFSVIIRLNDITRPEVMTRDQVITTRLDGTETDIETRVPSANQITDETENMTWTRNGTENGGETGGESGTMSGGQGVSHANASSQIETYAYEDV